MTMFFSVLMYIIGLLAMPFVILYRLPKCVLTKLGFLHQVPKEMVTNGLNETTGVIEKMHYLSWYDFQEIHHQCDIRVLLTLGRERVPKSYPKLKERNLIELTGDVYCLNTTDSEMKVSIDVFEINKTECPIISSVVDLSKEYIIPAGQYVNLLTVLSFSIGYSIEEEFSIKLNINDKCCELTDVAKRMIKN